MTEYTISVGYDVTSLSLSATADHSDAKTSISGKNALEVGKNTRTVTVTAPNGSTKKYTVVITRAKAPSTTSGTNPTTTGSTTAPPPEDALDVTVDGLHMVISDTQASVELPKGFSWSTITINRVDVPAAVNNDTGMTLLYLIAEETKDSGYFIYDVEADRFSRFRDLTVVGGTYLLYDLPADQELSGMIRSTLDYVEGQVSAYVYRNISLSDFYVVWAAPMGGQAGWYTYDKREGTLQRHHTATVVGDAITTPSTTTPDKEVGGEVDEEQSGSFFEENQQILLIGGIVLAGIVLLVLLFVMLSAGGRRKGKH